MPSDRLDPCASGNGNGNGFPIDNHLRVKVILREDFLVPAHADSAVEPLAAHTPLRGSTRGRGRLWVVNLYMRRIKLLLKAPRLSQNQLK
ncbi:predicted protein [Histoplasma mississippiense (nom. inval.)]|uniref:predicted protein n=1 Tax=Ajellomyces capsulatus (strain NAm1 / WU24) TaxID=2059318 RepID=UPI000157CC5A|nr:predicted protein [Histoplasma mississippiense (nom. inval.)]EDN10084.1 predicted protein [Histoplasma mississippiense (nom. inval.)]